MRYKYKLIVSAGSYQANTIIGLTYELIKHRLWHLFKGHGWIDQEAIMLDDIITLDDLEPKKKEKKDA